MRYHVTGINHDTGARMTLDLEAVSKAAVERKARNAGMDVQHVVDVSAGDAQSQPERHSSHRGEYTGGSGSLVKIVVIVAIVAVVVYFGWAKIQHLLRR